MTNFDIQQASLLDILFAQRNKQYGAYMLRKYYNNRLLVALGLTLTAAFSMFLLAGSFGGTDPMAVFEMPTADKVIIQSVEFPKQDVKPIERPKTKQADFRTEALTTRIIIEKTATTNVASTDDLKDALIGTKKIMGDIAPPDIFVQPPATAPGPGSQAAPPAEEEHPFVAHPSEMPEYPGGDAAWRAYLARHINVPGDMEPGEKRSVLIRFLVAEDGSVTAFEVIRSAGATFDNEVLRVLRRMPKWKPARQNGHSVSTSFQQPVTFQAPED
jgi:periplasmic protein TonB